VLGAPRRLRASIVYAPGDPWVRLQERLSLLPAVPVSGSGGAHFQPIWAQDVVDCVLSVLDGGGDGRDRFELAGPDTLSYDDIVRVIVRAGRRRRRLLHVPLPAVRAGLRALEWAAGPAAFATWDEAELMEVPMVSARGSADVRALGVTPQPMPVVLGA
jgi:NADH dehydrogenase